MLTTRKIYGSMFEDVHKLMSGFENRNLTAADWHNLFDYGSRWKQPESYSGYGLFDRAKLVGFIGLIFSNRLIGQRVEQFCNLTGWYVLEEYRGYSVSLLVPVMKIRNCTITDLSPSPLSCLLLRRFGFKELDSRIRIIFPRRNFGYNGFSKHIISGSHDNRIIEEQIEARDLVLFHDHLGYKCRHLLVNDDRDSCYVVYTEIKQGPLPYCYIHYISRMDVFVKYGDMIVAEVVKNSKGMFAVVDRRLVSNVRIPHSFEMPFRTRKLYKSPTLRPEQIDNLYSELILLNLGAFPKLRSVWGDISNSLSRKANELFALSRRIRS